MLLLFCHEFQFRTRVFHSIQLIRWLLFSFFPPFIASHSPLSLTLAFLNSLWCSSDDASRNGVIYLNCSIQIKSLSLSTNDIRARTHTHTHTLISTIHLCEMHLSLLFFLPIWHFLPAVCDFVQWKEDAYTMRQFCGLPMQIYLRETHMG